MPDSVYLIEGNSLWKYYGKTDRKTPLAVTNELFFNFHEDKSLSILDHELWINSREYLVLNEKRHRNFLRMSMDPLLIINLPEPCFQELRSLKMTARRD